MLHHSIRGEGPPLLLLHGFLGSGRNLTGIARRWPSPRKIILADLPGHGASPALPAGADLFTAAGFLAEFLDGLSLTEPIDIVGHSLGGRISLALGALAPLRIHRLVLLDIGPGPTSHLPSNRVAQILAKAPAEGPSRQFFRDYLKEAGISEELLDWLLMNIEPQGKFFGWRIHRPTLIAFHEKSGEQDLWPTVESGHLDIAAVYGDRGYLSAEDLHRFERGRVPTRPIADAGHFVHAEQTEATVRALAELLT